MSARRYFRKAVQALENPSRVVDYIREPRQLVIGGPLTNRLGLQIARTLIDHAAWSLRSRVAPSEHVATLEREGVLVIPNFLPDDAFAMVHAEICRSMHGGTDKPPWRRYPYGENFVSDQILVTYHHDLFPATRRYLRDNHLIAELAASVSKRRLTYKPHMMVQVIAKTDWSRPHHDLDYNQFSHVDRHYPFIKAFFYLEDVGADTAPYCYARGSHRVTLARLRYEYEYSVRHATIRRDGYERTPEQLAADDSLRELTERHLHDIGCATEPIVGKRNTLIISNNQGFHRRAPLRGTLPRVMAVIDYKYLESRIAQMLYPVLKHAYRREP